MYGTTNVYEEEEDIEANEARDSFNEAAQSSRSALSHVGPANKMVSIRSLKFIKETSDEYDMVPSLVGENMALVADDNLLYSEHRAGKLYYSEQAFYNPNISPEYVVTVSPHIYRDILTELDHSSSIPCGMYFCCQGGEFGAHVGASHDEDNVDIKLAQVLLAIFFTTLAVLSYTLDEQ